MVLRGYQQACGVGGQVDPNMATSYRAAKAAGITNVDAYMFPCTGTGHNGVACKPPTTQITDFENAVRAAGLAPTHLWLDIEPCAAGATCTCWNQNAATNLAVARQFVARMRQSPYSWGVYANANQWAAIFGAQGTVLASDLPFWAVQADGAPGVNTVTRFCGGACNPLPFLFVSPSVPPSPLL